MIGSVKSILECHLSAPLDKGAGELEAIVAQNRVGHLHRGVRCAEPRGTSVGVNAERVHSHTCVMEKQDRESGRDSCR